MRGSRDWKKRGAWRNLALEPGSMGEAGRLPRSCEASWPMASAPRPRAVRHVLRRELREAFRDRNVLLQLVLLPLFLYPLLGFGGFQVFLVVKGAQEGKVTVIAVDPQTPPLVRGALSAEENVRLIDVPEELDPRDGAPAAEAVRRWRDTWSDEEIPAPSALLAWWRDPQAAQDSARVFFDASRERSEDARELVWGSLTAHRDSLVLERARGVGLGMADVELWTLERENTASSRQMGRWILAMVLPIFLMLMLPHGIYYAALDSVVGERERGTWETILTSPLRRGEILLGKFLHVLFAGLLTFTLNLISLLLFLSFVLKLLGVEEFSVDIPARSVLLMLLAAVLAGAFLSALMMVVAAPARSYREGQAALTPVYLVAAFAGLAIAQSQEQFQMTHALIPMVNVTALLKAAIRDEVPLLPALVTYAELALLATLSIAFAARLSGRDQVFFDDDLSLKKLLRLGRKPE